MRNYYKQAQVDGFLRGLQKVNNERSYINLQEQLKEMAKKCEIDAEDFEFLFAKTLANDDPQITKIFKDLMITAKLKWSEDLKENKEAKEEYLKDQEEAERFKLKMNSELMRMKHSIGKAKLLK